MKTLDNEEINKEFEKIYSDLPESLKNFNLSNNIFDKLKFKSNDFKIGFEMCLANMIGELDGSIEFIQDNDNFNKFAMQNMFVVTKAAYLKLALLLNKEEF